MKNNKHIVVISKLPKAGLGNKLFPWASGLVFAHVNNAEHKFVGMTAFHPMTFLRRERSKRFYRGYFKKESLMDYRLFLKHKEIKQKDADKKVDWQGVAVFKEIPHYSEMFITIKNYRELIIAHFWKSLTKRVKDRIELHKPPIIALHVRMGDYRPLKEGEDFEKVGNVRTPLKYFQEVLNLLRQTIGWDCPATIFSDGNDEDLKELLDMPNVDRAEDDLDIVHMVLMSKSKVLVMSATSTFSFWAGFLSDGILINHYQHKHKDIRNQEFNKASYEGAIDPNKGELDPQLVKELKQIEKKN
jgi:hypothetical protein